MSKLYVLVRNDMPKNYQAVQAGHAVAEHMLNYPETWKNQTLVYLRVENENNLFQYLERVCKIGGKYSPFYEPDMDDQMTAMAVLSDPKVDELFCKMRLV